MACMHCIHLQSYNIRFLYCLFINAYYNYELHLENYNMYRISDLS